MSKRSGLGVVSDLFNSFGSAIAVSRAMEARRAPRASDLKQLGIDAASWGRIERY